MFNHLFKAFVPVESFRTLHLFRASYLDVKNSRGRMIVYPEPHPTEIGAWWDKLIDWILPPRGNTSIRFRTSAQAERIWKLILVLSNEQRDIGLTYWCGSLLISRLTLTLRDNLSVKILRFSLLDEKLPDKLIYCCTHYQCSLIHGPMRRLFTNLYIPLSSQSVHFSKQIWGI